MFKQNGTPATQTSASPLGSPQYIMDLVKTRFGVPLAIKPFQLVDVAPLLSASSVLNTFLLNGTKQKAVFYGDITFSVFDDLTSPPMSFSSFLGFTSKTLDSTAFDTSVGLKITTPIKNYVPNTVSNILLTSALLSRDSNLTLQATYSGHLIVLT